MVPALSLTAAHPGDGRTATVGMFVHWKDILGRFILDSCALDYWDLCCDLICAQRRI